MDLEELTQEKIDILENKEEINQRTDLLLNSEPLKDYENSIGSWTRDLIRAVTIINVYQKNEFIKKLQDRFALYIEDTELLEAVCRNEGIERLPAVNATGTVRIYGENGIIINPDIKIKKESITYTILEEKTIVSDSVEVKVICDIAGSSGNAGKGEINGFLYEYEGLTQVTNENSITNGKDEETDNELNERRWDLIKNSRYFQNQYWYKDMIEKLEDIQICKCLPRNPSKGHVTLILAGNDLNLVSAERLTTIKKYIDSLILSDVETHVNSIKEKKVKLEVTIEKNVDYSEETTKLEIFDIFNQYFSDRIFDTTEELYLHISDYIYQYCDSIVKIYDLKINDSRDDLKFNIDEKVIVDINNSEVILK